MKIILSRKGFDSQFGGFPSAIMPDGELITFPIPQRKRKHSNNILYKDLKINDNLTYLKLMQDLGMNYDENSYCHLDPDLRKETYKRSENWKGLFGQAGAAQSNLFSQEVGKGDFFYFLDGLGRFIKRMENINIMI